jgi:chorismate dehydratase
LPGAKLLLGHPSDLAEQLLRGELDLGLIPSIEFFRGVSRGYRVMPGVAIAARGAVRSVKLFCRVHPAEIRRLALDAASRSSQALARVWLHDALGVVPEIVEELPIGVSPLESTADAVLLIGDKAMRVPEAAFSTVVDLAGAWRELTGLPFVFAVWVARGDTLPPGLAERLQACRDDGMAAADEIARRFAPQLGQSPAFCSEYLKHVLNYDLGPDEVTGLLAFRDRAAALELAPKGADLVFLDDRRHLAAYR